MRHVTVAEGTASSFSAPRAIYVLVLMALAAIVTGCAHSGPDLVEQGRLTLERSPSSFARVSWVEVREGEHGAVVAGSVRPPGPANSRREGHIHVTFVGPGNEEARSACSQPIWLRRRSPGRGLKSKHFRVEVDAAAPGGGEVKVAFLSAECPVAGP